MKMKYIRILKQKSGVAIMSVMLFFMVMMVMVGALTISSEGNMKVSGVSADYTAAYYAAEAGINLVVSDFSAVVDSVDTYLTIDDFVVDLEKFKDAYSTPSEIELFENSTTSAVVNIEITNWNIVSTNKTFEFSVVSTGIVNGQSRTLRTRVDLSYSPGSGNSTGFAVKHAILVSDKLTTNNHSIIGLHPGVTGPVWVATTATKPSDSIDFKKTFSGNVEVLKGAPLKIGNVSGEVVDGLMHKDFPPPPLGPFPPIVMDDISVRAVSVFENSNLKRGSISEILKPSGEINSGSYYIPRVELSGLISIEAKNNVFIVTDYLSFAGNVSFTGTGEVTFYVRKNEKDRVNNTFRISGNIGNSKAHLFIVYVDAIEGDTVSALNVNPGTHTNISGSFMFKNANINFANHTTFQGYLMTGGKNVTLSNHTAVTGSTLYYAPNAVVNVNSVVRGAIIAKSVDMSNKGEIFYTPAFDPFYPFNVKSPIVGPDTNEGVQTKEFRIHRTTEQ